MKYIFTLILCVFVVVLSISVDLEGRYRDYEEKTEVVIYFQNEKIKELEKEMRLLKTDMEILQEGYE